MDRQIATLASDWSIGVNAGRLRLYAGISRGWHWGWEWDFDIFEGPYLHVVLGKLELTVEWWRPLVGEGDR